MSAHGFTSMFAPQLDAYLEFKEKMGCYGSSRIWYLKRFDTYCTEHDRQVFDRDTVEGWVRERLACSGRYRSWMSYIRDFGRWLKAHENTDAYVLSERWKAPFVPAHPYLLSAHEIESFFAAAARLDAQSPWKWQAVAFFALMHSCGIRTGEARALAERARRPGRWAHRRLVVQGQAQPQAAPDAGGPRCLERLRSGIAANASRDARVSSSPPPAARSQGHRSGRCSTESGTRPSCHGPSAARHRGPTTSATTSPTPTSNGG